MVTDLIPGTHYFLPPVPNLDDTYTLQCAKCGHESTRIALLSAYDDMEHHWTTTPDHMEMLR